VDINELCSEFVNRAKCDGTKVILEPASASQIKSKFAAQ
jgi:AP-1-like transcription factor